MRKEVYRKWKKSGTSLRDLGREYHVDKKVIQRIITRGSAGDFSVHTSVNTRYLPKTRAKSAGKAARKTPATGRRTPVRKVNARRS